MKNFHLITRTDNSFKFTPIGASPEAINGDITRLKGALINHPDKAIITHKNELLFLYCQFKNYNTGEIETFHFLTWSAYDQFKKLNKQIRGVFNAQVLIGEPNKDLSVVLGTLQDLENQNEYRII